MTMASGRFVAVASGIAAVCAVALLCLAGSQYSSIVNDQSDRSELAQAHKVNAAEVQQLEAIMLKQQKMEGKEQKLLASIEKGEQHAAKVLEEHHVLSKKAAVHAIASQKHKVSASKAKVVPKAKAVPKANVHKAQTKAAVVVHKAAATTATVAPKAAVAAVQAPVAKMAMQSVSLSEASGGADLGGAPKVDKVAMLKAELAKAEAAEKTTKDNVKAAKAETTPTKAAVKSIKKPITGADFIKLPDKVATTKDSKIAKEAGLMAMGWMGSGKNVDSMLRKLNCDPSSFVCSGTDEQKKQAASIIKKIQESIMSDANQVKAYGWKEEHALPPAPHM